MTDNGACYRSRDFAAAVGGAKHRFTRPYRPQTIGKVERFTRTRTLADERADARPYDSDDARTATYSAWLHDCNHRRRHTAFGGLTPAERVHNLTGNYT
ncbi:Integrase core domain protein [Clavibacter michiganensis subsp. michiganensis]|uniref:Integrase core domain protein n=2 Tax=Clavibacter michiganensis TaxID=28447 RepID=A0A251XHD6_CLAMM|nr:Integrase core domain protein [Clavibacter michiganensis subsp. michiganensis]OUD83328.1 Integrase core domain protein [Clavibacter michiganensis subsp. michiganensis]OUD85104.1 Integrase core domain protein [Clavibacter michiganensis subsp. michiganensis]OUD86248.1 Integrase core domain protein [Clavibacter michiganensis subsp. michiganensis]OUD97181.1 Integrase core domain protein [Clavibacter michiganensis subsp. michiganensis]